MRWLEISSNIASVLTALIAASAAVYFWCDARRKRQRLETYLKILKGSTGRGHGQRTILHLMARLGLTEAEILHASFRSHHIKRTLATDEETGRAAAMLLEYEDYSN